MPDQSATRREPPLGGFLGIDLPPERRRNLRRHWRLAGIESAYVNARSALVALLRALPRRKLWLPAYMCPELTREVPASRRRFYPVGEQMTPSVAFLERELGGDDLLLAVNYFGRAPAPDFLDFVATRPSVLFIEDCAQALDTGRPAWGDWRLYSPRKLVGVPDGGMLVACSERARAQPLPHSVPGHFDENVDRARSQWMRFEDVDEASNETWHALHQAKEAGLGVSPTRISRLAWHQLGLLDPVPLMAARRRNYAVLARQLRAFALFDLDRPDFTPLGFPVLVPVQRRAEVRARLHAQRVFPSVHWDRLVAPREAFATEHAMAASLLTLTCDHRYSVDQMQKQAELFRDALR